MTLVHRVETLDPDGGRFGLGLIRAEADIHPDDWFMVCHFVDDRVMPGTLMYECCLHTLRIFLMRMGWMGERDRVAFEPLPGVANRLRCRGQVIESTRVVTYEVAIKELGYGPEPYAIADALMYADGKPIVEITDMAIRLSGTTSRGARAALEADPATARGASRQLRYRYATASGSWPSPRGSRRTVSATATGRSTTAGSSPACPPRRIRSSIGSSRSTDRPWAMAAGTAARAEYDIPEDAWYFEADRQDRVPYAVLLEAALQSCGWVSAYMGSALASDEPLKFRNLGGTATLHVPVDRWSGTLTRRSRAPR